MIVRAPRPFHSWLAAVSLALGVMTATATQARAQNRQSLPGNRAPAQSSALRGASQRPRASSSPLFSARGETVQLPYNMVWGDTQQRLAALFAGVGAKVIDKKAEPQKEIWTVQGLIAPDLQTSLFTFQQGNLTAMEFDYGQTEWDLAKFNDKMGLFRRVLEAKCGGPGEMVSRDTTQEPNSTVKQTFTGYQWTRGDTLVQLFYFSAEDTAKSLSFRTISVHYHYREPSLEQPLPMPEAGAPFDPNSNPLFGGKGGTAARVESPSPSPTTAPEAKPSPEAELSPGAKTSTEAKPAPGTEPSPETKPSPEVKPMPGGKASPKAKPSPRPPENDPLPE